MHRYFIALALSLAALLTLGCTSNGHRIDQLAAAAGLTRSVIDTPDYSSVAYMKRAAVAGDVPLLIFLEGDGLPWRNGRQPSADPTTGNPLALRLLMNTPQQGVYLTRPCYHGLQAKHCAPEQWTGGRYSERIVENMAAAVRQVMRQADARQSILVGYSGGGVLALLIAERLEHIATVVTIAANLDIDAWTTHHDYLPLVRSLNPALSTQAHSWHEIHLQGARDTVVPPATTSAYFRRYPLAQRQVFEDYDHACCWADAWPEWIRSQW
jgi:pimeloyl-ACP methyl ester carboxylesterase